MRCDIVLCGVGGQGTVLASRIIAGAALKAGFSVFTSEVIGMSQREGAVIGHIRLGQHLYGGLIPDGRGDILLGFEPAEAVRGLKKLKPEGILVVNCVPVIPPAVYAGMSTYPVPELLDLLKKQYPGAYILDALNLARNAGNEKTLSMVLLGALSALTAFPVPEPLLLEAAGEYLPGPLLSVNKRAFRLGQAVIKNYFVNFKRGSVDYSGAV